MGMFRDRRWLDASQSFRGGAGWCLDAITESPENLHRVESERIWYLLGLCRPDMSDWFQYSIETHGKVTPYRHREVNSGSDPLFMLWGKQDKLGGSEGTLTTIDKQLPQLRLLAVLGSGAEPSTYYQGVTRAQEILWDLQQRIRGGENFKTTGPVDLSYVSQPLRSELLHLDMQDPVLFGDGMHYLFECLWQYDS